MSPKNDIYAFPSTHPDLSFAGMTLRDYFAAKVMQAAMTSATNLEKLQPTALDTLLLNTARLCYKISDTMLKAREE
jgi:hypothetical protein